MRCGRCGRTIRVTYGMQSGHVHRYQRRRDDSHVGPARCIGIGGVRVDQAVAAQVLEAVSGHAVEAAIRAADQATRAGDEVRQALGRELAEARYGASLAARRYDVVDPTKRHVARELEARWNAALEHVAQLEERIARLASDAAVRPRIDRAALMDLAHDLPAAWNAPGTDARTKQRLLRILVQEVVLDLDEAANEAVIVVHWTGGQHTELRVARVRCGRYPEDRRASSVEVVRALAGHWPDRDPAVTMNRMRCRAADGQSWTTVRVRELRERLGVAPFDPAASRVETISADAAAQRLGICVASVRRLIRDGALPATQLLPSAPWQVPVAVLASEAVRIGVQEIVGRRPRSRPAPQGGQTLALLGI